MVEAIETASTEQSFQNIFYETSLQEDAKILEELRDILIAPEQSEIERLRNELTHLQARVGSDMQQSEMSPFINRAIEEKIRQSPDEMIDLLYPLLGKMITRSVSEAVRNLVDRIDAKLRNTFDFRRPFRQYKAAVKGVSEGELLLRDSLPFCVEEIFLIHRETGLLLRHKSSDIDGGHDSDLISAMLTAIQDFVQEAFGRGIEGELSEIQFGEKRILLELSEYVYTAVVVDGIEPYDYRQKIRNFMNIIERTNLSYLAAYSGDAEQLIVKGNMLSGLMLIESM